MNFKSYFAVLASLGGIVWAQPEPAPLDGDILCGQENRSNPMDTVVSTADRDGFYSLFDGTSKGWTQSCRTGLSNSDTVNGAVFRIDRSLAIPALYTAQRSGPTGGVLMTNKRFENYELRLETWPDFGNESGIFHRTPYNGKCLRTVLGYIRGSSLGGTWGQGGFVGRDFRPFTFGATEEDLTIPGNNQGVASNWTTITREALASGMEPELPCPETGCTQSDWRRLWDKEGWNEIRTQFYGGLSIDSKVYVKTWFRKAGDLPWVLISVDTTFRYFIPANRIGIEVHGGGRFVGNKGTWYRNIRWSPLDAVGKPLIPVLAYGSANPIARGFKATLSSGGQVLSGHSDRNRSLTMSDLQGRRLETFAVKAGGFRHVLKTSARGVLIIAWTEGRRVESIRIARPPLP